jgi:hypothetical protein
MQKKKVTRIFFKIYQSSFFMLPAKEINNDERFCERIKAATSGAFGYVLAKDYLFKTKQSYCYYRICLIIILRRQPRYLLIENTIVQSKDGEKTRT